MRFASVSRLARVADGSKDRGDAYYRAHLRDTAFKVLRRQCTDPRFISPARGGFDGHAEEGRYLCAACHSPLYASDAKFEAGCGWPAFHSNVDGAVRAVACLAHDVEGVARELPYREIVCNACSSHLGHVFTGEGHGHATDERHCVNSSALAFAPDGSDEVRECTYSGAVF